VGQINHFFLTEPHWRPRAQWRQGEIPPEVLDWLEESGSLTHRLKQSFATGFRVHVLGQAWDRPFAQDAMALNMALHRRSFVREVQLRNEQGVLICARTTIPSRTLKGLNRLARLGNRALGEVIFSYPDLCRTQLDLVRLAPSQLSPLVKDHLGQVRYIWGRRNTYTIAGRPFLVCEFFLPSVFAS